MSMFERDEYKWRETYFVLFDSAKRPTLGQIEDMLRGLNDRFELLNPTADEDDRFESITVMSSDDYAALDVSYEVGEEVVEQAKTLHQELKSSVVDAEERAKLAQLLRCDAALRSVALRRDDPRRGRRRRPR